MDERGGGGRCDPLTVSTSSRTLVAVVVVIVAAVVVLVAIIAIIAVAPNAAVAATATASPSHAIIRRRMMLTTGWAVSAWLLLQLLQPPLAVQAAAGFVEYKVGVLMTTKLDSPFDLERCGPAVDLALDMVNKKFLAHHRVRLKKVESR